MEYGRRDSLLEHLWLYCSNVETQAAVLKLWALNPDAAATLTEPRTLAKIASRLYQKSRGSDFAQYRKPSPQEQVCCDFAESLARQGDWQKALEETTTELKPDEKGWNQEIDGTIATIIVFWQQCQNTLTQTKGEDACQRPPSYPA